MVRSRFSIFIALVEILALPLLITASTAKPPAAHYLFGTLETANGSIFTALGLSYTDVAKKEHDAGVAVAQVTIAWKDYETSDGAFNEHLMASVANKINAFLQAGQKVDVQLAIHYVPSWIMHFPDAYYTNQYGVTAPQTDGYDDPNYVDRKSVV